MFFKASMLTLMLVMLACLIAITRDIDADPLMFDPYAAESEGRLAWAEAVANDPKRLGPIDAELKKYE